jgi:aryl-alcohol dehydrogenase-like predicted oxidoreductase
MRYRTIGTDPASRKEVSVLSLGAMRFGTDTDEATSFAILDRFVEAGGTFIDSSNNYAWWADNGQGGQSEELLGRWRKDRGIGDEIVFATKLGARPAYAGGGWANPEGLSADVIKQSAQASRERLGVDKIDLLYAHIEDPKTPLQETVEAFAGLVADGVVGLLGASNHWAWRVERARTIAEREGLPGYEVLQFHHTYLRQRTDVPSRRSPDGEQGVASGDLLSYVRAEPRLTLVAYTPLLSGAYVRDDKPLDSEHDHAGTPIRRAALDKIVKETGATANQVVLSWLMGGDIPVLPLIGASSVSQLNESLASVDLELTAEQRQQLDSAF